MSGMVVAFGSMKNKRLDHWTVVFLASTALTSLTGFLFPFKDVTTAIILGVISLMVVETAILARYPLHLSWRRTFVITACAALHFNIFVLVVQAFANIGALKALAPTQKEPPFAIAHLVVVAVFVSLKVQSIKRFRGEPSAAKSPGATA